LNYYMDTLNAKLRLQRLDLIFGRANDLLFGADRLVIIILGAEAVIHGRMSIGMLVAFLSYKDQFSTRVGNLLGSWLQLRMLNVQTDRLSDIVMTEPEVRSVPLLHHSGLESAALRAEQISKRYADNAPWILRSIDLAVAPGQSIAITGPSGCGKTTLLKVLMGLLAPTDGRVLINDTEIGDGRREHVSGVLQDDHLFAGSIAENVCAFDPFPDQGWIEECAARAAILADIRRMPMGFETLVGDMGSTLSGGQIQRLVLARAIYRRPRILFLDEATSHLDETTEAAIASALRDLRMTRVIVSHRPATIAHADSVMSFTALNHC
jgi:ATP-binding cassette subfamily B protein RaxB